MALRTQGRDQLTSGLTPPGPTSRLSYGPCLAGTALAYALVHHLGSLPQGLGDGPRGTRWADWLDLLTPYLVLTPAALTLRAARATERTWWVFALGVVVYASGHGIHLSSNSVGNVEPGPTEHLWDEVVGHLLWYAGVALVVAALARTTLGRPRPVRPWAYPLALAVGFTWATNTLGGEGTAGPGLVLALIAVGFGRPRRDGLPVVFVVAGVTAAVILTGMLVADLV